MESAHIDLPKQENLINEESETAQDPALCSPQETEGGESAEDIAREAGTAGPGPDPDDQTLLAAMEGILFAMGDAVPIETLASALAVPEERARQMADHLADKYRDPSCGLVLNWYEDAVQLSTKPELTGYLIRIASQPKKPKLTAALLETLSIIAFRQPVTRMEIENIRGVNSDFAVSRLVSYDLVQEVGRKEVPGRPLLFGTTEQFLRSFGIRSIDDLPEPDSLQMETFREAAEEEVSSGLNV